jgi:hypothetical protein
MEGVERHGEKIHHEGSEGGTLTLATFTTKSRRTRRRHEGSTLKTSACDERRRGRQEDARR